MDFRLGTRRLDGLSSRNPEAGWTFVLEPGGRMDFRPGTRRLVELLSRNLMVVWTFKGTFSYIFSTRSHLRQNLEVEYGLGGNLGPRMLLQTLRSYLRPEGRLGTRRFLLDLEVVLNTEVSFRPGGQFEPGGCSGPGGRLATRRFLLNPGVVLNLEVSFGPGGCFELGGCSRPGGRFEPGGCSRTGGRFEPEVALDPEDVLNPRLYKSLEDYLFLALRSFHDPETAWGPEGTVLRLPRQGYYQYLFGFRILPLGSWPLSSSYVVLYFCKKSLTGLEGAGVGVMTQVPGFAAFHVWRSRVLISPWTPMRLRLHKSLGSFDSILSLAQTHSCFMNWHVSYDAPCVRVSVQAPYAVLCMLWMVAGVGAGAFLDRNREAGVLPEAWMIFPNQFAPYFSISSSNTGNNLCTQVNRSCSFSAGFP
ncbi:hypothetical protein F2Q69_00023301 [Brassica cretica]|uniref:Uncharacterized protein n=1 Tax=Brassica cretica TaxID=69181 RepID=A0A8S9QFJ8_BRACR|nr:hypothetical protein F2Q69_00023301 [Brassica cretica]